MAVAYVNGTDLFYTDIGRGIPCLVMHGAWEWITRNSARGSIPSETCCI